MYRTKICAVLAYFCLNLVAMATPFVTLKIRIAYSTWILRQSHEKNYQFLAQNWNRCNYGIFCL